MRVRNLFASGLAVVVVASCSQSNTEASLDDKTLAAELELALFNGPGHQPAAVTSAVELTRSQDPGTAPRVAPTTRTRTPAPSTQLVLTDEAPAVDAAPVEEATEIVAEVAAAPAPEAVQPTGVMVASTGGLADHTASGNATARGSGRDRIIIRGGVVGNDPCVRHGPGMTTEATGGILGVIGTLVNDRTPPVGGARPDRGRAASPQPRGAGGMGGMGGMGGGIAAAGGGGGSRFPGGIR